MQKHRQRHQAPETTIPYPGPRCATCWRTEVKRRKEAAHRSMTAKVYDTDTDFYDLLYAFQDGKCWICRLATGATKRLANDHDHKTDLLRGLLCGECNQFLGRRVRDNPEVGLRIFGISSTHQHGSYVSNWGGVMNKTEERELLLRYRPRLRRMAASMTLQFPDRADDLAQEAWIALWLATRTYDGRDGVTLDYWLIRNAHDRMRVMIRHWTAQCRDARRTELAGDPREKSRHTLTTTPANSLAQLRIPFGLS